MPWTISTAMIASHLTNEIPRVAMLSYATHSSSAHPMLAKVRTATELARTRARESSLPMEIEGEIQVDAALDGAIARNDLRERVKRARIRALTPRKPYMPWRLPKIEPVGAPGPRGGWGGGGGGGFGRR